MYTKYYKLLLLLLCIIAITDIAHSQANYTKIQNYKVEYGVATHFPRELMILRSFDNYGKHYLLLVNPQTLETRIDESDFYQVRPMTLLQARTFFFKTPYEKALYKADKQSVAIQDAGIEI